MMWKIEKLPAVRGETRFGPWWILMFPGAFPGIQKNIKERCMFADEQTGHSKDALPFCGFNKVGKNNIVLRSTECQGKTTYQVDGVLTRIPDPIQGADAKYTLRHANETWGNRTIKIVRQTKGLMF